MSLWGWVGLAAAEGVVASRGGSGRKLQAEDGRFATRVKISEIRRCCTLVSSWV